MRRHSAGMRAVTSWMRAVRRRAIGAVGLVVLALACREAIVEPVAVAQVMITGNAAELRLGQSAQLTTTLKSTEGWTLPNQGVTWSIGDASIATVTPSGQVTAVKRGTVTVTASAGGVSGTASVTVIGVSGVAIAPDTLAVVVAEQQAVTANVTADPGVSVPPSWVARDTSVAQVDATGRISARKLGVTWVVASAEVASDSVKVRVVPVPVLPPASGAAAPVTTSVLSGAVSLTIPPGATTAPALTVAPVPTAPADDRIPAGGAYVFGPDGTQFTTPITVSLRYDPAQVVARKRPFLRLALVEGATASEVVTEVPGSAVDLVAARVSAPVSHFSTYAILIPADPSQVAVNAGGSQSTFAGYELPVQPSVLVRDAQGRPVPRARVRFDVTGGGGSLRNGISATADSAVAGVDGLVTLGAKWKLGPDAGTNTLTVRAYQVGSDIIAATATLTATAQANPVARVVVAPDTATITVGTTQQLTATLYDARDTVMTNRTVTWTSSDPTKATVSSAGLVTAVGAGTVTITASSEGKSAAATLTVRSRAFVLAQNGVTVTCSTDPVGATGVVNGVVYTKRSRAQLTALIAAGDFAALTTSCTSGITDMSLLFDGQRTFNGDISTWDVSSVVSMQAMFRGASIFNQPIGAWNTANVVDMSGTFYTAEQFNQAIGAWDVGRVTNMSGMFVNAFAFNQPIGSWNTANVTTMVGMFSGAGQFNQPIGGWNTARVTTMASMFRNAAAFNQPIGNWSVGAVTAMAEMFDAARSFNQDLSGWCVSGIATAPSLFATATDAWTQPKPVWGTCPVTSVVANVDAIPSAIIPAVGASRQLTAVVRDGSGNALTGQVITWTSSDQSKVTVSSAGVVTALAAGTTNIVAASGGRSDTVTVTVVTLGTEPTRQTIAVGYRHACALTSDGTAYCWGGGVAYGSNPIGNGTATSSAVPTPVIGGLKFVSIHIGPARSFTCGLTAAGEVYCWGSNTDGQLGNGTFDASTAPVRAAPGLTFREISTDHRSVCGLQEGGAIYCWGFNIFGQLGDGTTTTRTTPVRATGIPDPIRIFSGIYGTCAMSRARQGYCWGQLYESSSGTRVIYSTPTLIAGGTAFAEFSMGVYTVCGRRLDGVTMCWGQNGRGELGDGTTIDRSEPTPVVGDPAFVTSTGGAEFYRCELNIAGQPLCWGRGYLEWNGVGSNTLIPTSFSTSPSFSRLAVYGFGCGLDATGRAYCWGPNDQGNLGDGTTTFRAIPTAVSTALRFATSPIVTSGGSVSSFRSCKDVIAVQPLAVSGVYQIAPDGTAGTQTTAYCDMSTDGGGWTKVLGHTITNGVAREVASGTVISGLRLAALDSGMVSDVNLSSLRTQTGFSEVRFACFKPNVGRTIHIRSRDVAVLDYLTRRSDVQPSAVGSFTRFADDNSIVGAQPDQWGELNGAYRVGRWGSTIDLANPRLTFAPMFVVTTAHWNLTQFRMECDDYNGQVGAPVNGAWSVFVR